MTDRFVVRQTKIFLYGAIAIVGYFGWRLGKAAYLRAVTATAFIDWTLAIFCAATAIAAVYGIVWYARRLNTRPPLAVFDRGGVTTDTNERINWSDATKIYTWTGVLFIKDGSKREWALRLDPAEIGYCRMKELKAYIRDTAPAHLTEDLT